MNLERKVDFAIKLLRSIPTNDGPIELSYSGGKDSDVILELAKMAGIPFEAIYKNTTIDPPGTIQHCRENGVTILKPKTTFLQLVEKKGSPSRFVRFCCEVLKEYKVYNRAIQGIRRCESTARAKRYHEPEICRVYNPREKVRVYLPILEWTDEDVADFIAQRGIKCAPMYYDGGGYSTLNAASVVLVARLRPTTDSPSSSNIQNYSNRLSKRKSSFMKRTPKPGGLLTVMRTTRFTFNSFVAISTNTGYGYPEDYSPNRQSTQSNISRIISE